MMLWYISRQHNFYQALNKNIFYICYYYYIFICYFYTAFKFLNF